MATLEEVYDKIVSDNAEKKALVEALATKEGTEAFLAQRDCDATPEGLVAFLRGRVDASGELSDGELGDVSGGGPGALSAISAIISATMSSMWSEMSDLFS